MASSNTLPSGAQAPTPSDAPQIETLEERIRRRAHELWLANGRPAGTDVVDWLAAEQEILDEQRGALPRSSLAQCSRCGRNETSLYINGVPVCLECESKITQSPDAPFSKEATPATPPKKSVRRQQEPSAREKSGVAEIQRCTIARAAAMHSSAVFGVARRIEVADSVAPVGVNCLC